MLVDGTGGRKSHLDVDTSLAVSFQPMMVPKSARKPVDMVTIR